MTREATLRNIERMQTTSRMSKVVAYGDLVFVCGQTANRSASAFGDVPAQTHEAFARLDGLLAQAGSNRSCLVSATIHLRSMEDFEAMNAVWESWLPAGNGPARTTVQAPLSSPNLLVEVTAIVAKAAS
jgi:enamine deaminase RidA (YjgF/YER057c/UK114 family)